MIGSQLLIKHIDERGNIGYYFNQCGIHHQNESKNVDVRKSYWVYSFNKYLDEEKINK